MSRVLVISDINLNINKVKVGLKRARELNADTIVITGNYFSSLLGPRGTQEMIDFWEEFLGLIRDDTRIVPLLGEEDLNYLNVDFKTPGKQEKFSRYLDNRLDRNYRFVPCVAIDGVMYSHAGVATNWLRDNHIMLENELRFRMGKHGGAGLLEVGIFKLRSWVPFLDETSCFRSSVNNLISFAPPSIKQVVGHTLFEDVSNIGKLWFANSCNENEFVFVNNGDPQILNDFGVNNGKTKQVAKSKKNNGRKVR